MSNVTGPGTAQDRNRLFEQLVDRYQEPVLRMCYYCLCDKTQAEDAAQETFLKLYRTLDNYRGDCSEKTWIMKIATRVCYDMNHSGWFRFMNRHVTPEMLPAEEAPEKRNDAELAEAVMKLPYKLREVILLSGNECERNCGCAEPFPFLGFGQAETGKGETEENAGRERTG